MFQRVYVASGERRTGKLRKSEDASLILHRRRIKVFGSRTAPGHLPDRPPLSSPLCLFLLQSLYNLTVFVFPFQPLERRS